MPRSGSLSGVPLGHVSIWQFLCCSAVFFLWCHCGAIQLLQIHFWTRRWNRMSCQVTLFESSQTKSSFPCVLFVVFVSCSLELLIYSCVWGREKPKTIKSEFHYDTQSGDQAYRFAMFNRVHNPSGPGCTRNYFLNIFATTLQFSARCSHQRATWTVPRDILHKDVPWWMEKYTVLQRGPSDLEFHLRRT